MGACGENKKKRNTEKKEISSNLKTISNLQTFATIPLQKTDIDKYSNVFSIIKDNNYAGKGFLCSIPYPDANNLLSVLITCNHVLNIDDIKSKKEIKLMLNDFNSKILKLDESRKIYISDESKYDLTMIEIKMKDGLNTKDIFEIDSEIIKEGELSDIYTNLSIQIINNSNEKDSFSNKGIIKGIDDDDIKIEHSCKIEEGESGVPILNFENSKVIGIHIGKNNANNGNLGIILLRPIEEFYKSHKYKNDISLNKNENNKIQNSKENDNNENLSEDKIDSLEKISEELNIEKNEINLVLNINNEDINKEIPFLGGFNELNDSNTKLFINDEEKSFKKYLIPKKEGLYNIKIMIYVLMNDCSYLFSECNKLKSIDLTYFNTENVTNMSYMFYGCSELTNLDLSSLNTKNVTNMSFMLKGCSNLCDINLKNFDTKKVNYMIGMFSDCSKLKNIDLSSFDTSNVTYMNYFFCRCFDLINLDLTSLNTQRVINMSSMFSGCTKLSIINLSSFNTKNVIYMNSMFSDCSNLENIDLSFLNTENVMNMSYMFSGCSKLSNIDLSQFNTNKITNMSFMFFDCLSLINIDLSTLDPKKVSNIRNMFSGCDNLKTIKINKNSFDKKKSKLKSNVTLIY